MGPSIPLDGSEHLFKILFFVFQMDTSWFLSKKEELKFGISFHHIYDPSKGYF